MPHVPRVGGDAAFVWNVALAAACAAVATSGASSSRERRLRRAQLWLARERDELAPMMNPNEDNRNFANVEAEDQATRDARHAASAALSVQGESWA